MSNVKARDIGLLSLKVVIGLIASVSLLLTIFCLVNGALHYHNDSMKEAYIWGTQLVMIPGVMLAVSGASFWLLIR